MGDEGLDRGRPQRHCPLSCDEEAEEAVGLQSDSFDKDEADGGRDASAGLFVCYSLRLYVTSYKVNLILSVYTKHEIVHVNEGSSDVFDLCI